mgnify:CR=1 FL=1
MFVRVLLFECREVVLLVWCSVRVFLLLSMCWCGLKDMVCILLFWLVWGGWSCVFTSVCVSFGRGGVVWCVGEVVCCSFVFCVAEMMFCVVFW